MLQLTGVESDFWRATEAREIPGVVAVATDRDGIVYETAAGRRDVGKPDPMTIDTVVWIASMTKAITGAAAMQLVEQGKLDLDGPIAKVLPELAAPRVLEGWGEDGMPRLRPAKGAITLKHLLTHTAGFCYDMWNGDMVKYLAHAKLPGIISCEHAALKTPIMSDPGTRWEYGTNIDFVGKAVEAVTGETLGAYLRKHVLEPLGMRDTGFKLRPDQRARLAAMHARGPDGTLTAIPFEVPQEPEFEMGGGGLYGTGPDYAAFIRMLLNGGKANGRRVLKPETVKLMGENHIGALAMAKMVAAIPAVTNDVDVYPDIEKKWGLTFMINTERTPEGRSAGSLAWAGLANTYYWIDPSRGIGGVILMQILPFADPKALSLFASFERGVYNALEGTRRAA